MQEKRKSKRFDLMGTIIMERIGGGTKREVPIEIKDVSSTGLGFACNELLEMNSVYKIRLSIMTGDVIDALINIVRFDNSGASYLYGGTFVGMPGNDSSKFKIYEMFDDANNR